MEWVIALVSALAGAVIGGVIAFAGENWLDRRRDQRAALAAAVLVAGELAESLRLLKMIGAQATAIPQLRSPPRSAWDALAVNLMRFYGSEPEPLFPVMNWYAMGWHQLTLLKQQTDALVARIEAATDTETGDVVDDLDIFRADVQRHAKNAETLLPEAKAAFEALQPLHMQPIHH